MDGIQNDSDSVDEKYAILCNLIEGIWLKRNDDDFYNVDLEHLPPLTSPEARRIASFIMNTLDAWGDARFDFDEEWLSAAAQYRQRFAK